MGRAPASLVLVATLLAAGGCAGQAGSPGQGGGVGRPTPDASLRIVFDGGDGDVRRATVECASQRDELGGFLRLDQPAAVCRRVADLRGVLLSRSPRGRVCAQVFGGPERARFQGMIGGRRIDRRFTRTDGCEIAEWERVESLLPRVR